MVIIYDREKQDGNATKREGHPIFKTEPFITINFPGDNLTGIDRPLREEDKREYPQAWERYQNKEKHTVDGMPLAHWPMMTRLQVAELNALNIWTVEQLVSLPQVHAHKVMGFEMLKAKAKQFLEIAAQGASIEKMEAERAAHVAEIAKRDTELADLRATVQQSALQVQALQQAMANLAAQAAQPKRRGRPPKDKNGAHAT